jgi:hypothetical protein
MNFFNDRKKDIRIVKNATLTFPTYPNCSVSTRIPITLTSQNPYTETIMSMPSILSDINTSESCQNSITPGSFFFFIFNLENYYHFLYDTLPYLYYYFKLKEFWPNLKIILPKNHTFLQFQKETFELLGLSEKDFVFADDSFCYETLFIPSSLTHSNYSNEAPDECCSFIWNKLLSACDLSIETPKKIYISRRSWIHGDTSNIGTNYTTRRKCMNEDELVDSILKLGYNEIFCERLTMKEKIALFHNATHIVGFIGGGMANCIFSKMDTHVFCIETPDFLRINSRFLHSMNHTNVLYLPLTQHASYEGPYPLFTRVKLPDSSIGEIEEWNPDSQTYSIKIPTAPVAGFSLSNSYSFINYSVSSLEKLDNGLNSPFTCNLTDLRNLLIIYS